MCPTTSKNYHQSTLQSQQNMQRSPETIYGSGIQLPERGYSSGSRPNTTPAYGFGQESHPIDPASVTHREMEAQIKRIEERIEHLREIAHTNIDNINKTISRQETLIESTAANTKSSMQEIYEKILTDNKATKDSNKHLSLSFLLLIVAVIINRFFK